MARASARSRNPAGHGGLIDNVVGFVSAIFAYIETRAALFAAESKAMLLQLVVVLAFALGALVAVLFGYIFVLASLIVGIAHATDVSWTWVALCAGLLHLMMAIISLLLVMSKLRGPLYPEMRAELKRDQQWLKSLSKTEQP